MNQLFKLFGEMGLPYFRQGSLSDEDYQPSFFTFWNIDTPNLRHRDNRAKSYALYIQVGFYTNDANKIYSVMDDFINLFSDKKNHCAVSFIGKECYEVVLAMQKFISKI